MSGNIGIVTDSASDLPIALAASESIAIVPLEVRLGDERLDDLATTAPEEFWKKAEASSELPETSAPSPGQFVEAFLAEKQQGREGVVCVTISSGLSATYQAALAAAAQVAGEIPVEVVDSRFATMGEGLVCLEAAEHARRGESLSAVAAAARAAIASVATFGALDTLEYLRRGGRIGGAQALIGSLLSIKPVIEVRGGVVEAESRQRTRSRSLSYLVEKAKAAGPLKRLVVVHANASDIEVVKDLLSPLPVEHELIVTYIGPVIGAHTGPGTIGICLVRSDA